MRVWVARAEPAASRTAVRLRALGHDPLVAPVFSVVPTNAPAPSGPFDALLLTSANAVDPLARERISVVSVFAVGHRTAERARAAGLGPVFAAESDAVALAAMVRESLAPGARLLHVAGEDRKAEPAAMLREAGYSVTTWIAYAAEPVDALPPDVAAALSEASLSAALHYSRRSAAIALMLAEKAGLDRSFRSLKHLCLSADVAAPLVEAGIAAHFVPARPDEASLLVGLANAPRQ